MSSLELRTHQQGEALNGLDHAEEIFMPPPPPFLPPSPPAEVPPLPKSHHSMQRSPTDANQDTEVSYDGVSEVPQAPLHVPNVPQIERIPSIDSGEKRAPPIPLPDSPKRKPPMKGKSSLEMDEVWVKDKDDDKDSDEGVGGGTPLVLELHDFYSIATMLVTIGYVAVYIIFIRWNPKFIKPPELTGGVDEVFPLTCEMNFTDMVNITETSYQIEAYKYWENCRHTKAVQDRVFHVYGWILKPIGALSLGLSFALKPRRNDPGHTMWLNTQFFMFTFLTEMLTCIGTSFEYWWKSAVRIPIYFFLLWLAWLFRSKITTLPDTELSKFLVTTVLKEAFIIGGAQLTFLMFDPIRCDGLWFNDSDDWSVCKRSLFSQLGLGAIVATFTTLRVFSGLIPKYYREKHIVKMRR